MRHCASHEGDIARAGKTGKIADILAAPAQKSVILLARGAGAYPMSWHLPLHESVKSRISASIDELSCSEGSRIFAMNVRRKNMATSGAPLFESNPEIMGGRLVFRGTRIPVEVLFENLADGTSLDEILDSYPGQRRESAIAAIELAGAAIEQVEHSRSA
jgi:uncharacterized protein (DUF433 family)